MPGARHTVVVGAGLAGLSAAVHLAAAGRDVTVVEAAPEPGGCCGSATVGRYRFDTGPSVLTMPEVIRAVFGSAGEEADHWLPMDRLDPYYRITFPDHSHLDVVPGADRMVEEVRRLAGSREADRYARFRARLTLLFEATWRDFVARDYPRFRDLARPLALARVAALGGFRRLDRLVAAHLDDWRLRRAHTFQALYVGLSPHQALGVYAVVTYMDTVGGVYFPRQGGMYALPTALASVAEKAGARIRYVARAERVEADAGGVSGVRLGTGERLAAGSVVVACDLPSAYARLLPDRAREPRLRHPRYASSCLVTHFGLPRSMSDQAHHTVHLGRGWRETFTAIRAGRIQPGTDPNLLVTNPAGDTSAAPPGCATLTVLEPTANLSSGQDWGELTGRLRGRLLARMAALGYGDLAADAEAELIVDPPGWAAHGHSAGTPFGLDHRLTQTAWFRPGNISRAVPGLYFAGMHTVPGVGVPSVLISGRLAAERILESSR